MGRYLSYAVVILLCVVAGLIVFSREERMPGGNTAAAYSPPPPTTPWKETEKVIAEANDGFAVEQARADVAPLAGTKSQNDWPRLNGPRRDNRSTENGLLQSWPSKGPEIVWIAKGMGAGYSSLSVADSVIYTMGYKGTSEAIIAVDSGTGKKIWSTPFANRSNPSYEGCRSTPTVAGDAVFALSASGDLVCMAREAGAIRWKKNILKEFRGNNIGWGISESVLVDNGKVICTPGGEKGTVVALKADTGEEVWTSLSPQKEQAGYASPTIAEVAGLKQYVHFTSRGVLGVRASDGKYLWRDDKAANGTANCCSPLVAGDLVFASSNYGTGGALVQLSGNDESTQAKSMYHTKDMQVHHGDMVLADGFIYGASDAGFLACLELKTGKVRWRSRAVGKGSITAADGRLYVRTEAGPVVLADMSSDKFTERGRFEQPRRSKMSAWSHPVVSNGRLLLRDQDVLICYDVKAKSETAAR